MCFFSPWSTLTKIWNNHGPVLNMELGFHCHLNGYLLHFFYSFIVQSLIQVILASLVFTLWKCLAAHSVQRLQSQAGCSLKGELSSTTAKHLAGPKPSDQLWCLEILISSQILPYANSLLTVLEKTLNNLCPLILEALSDGQLCFKGQIGVADLACLDRWGRKGQELGLMPCPCSGQKWEAGAAEESPAAALHTWIQNICAQH